MRSNRNTSSAIYFGLEPQQRRDIYHVPLRADDITMMNRILDLAPRIDVDLTNMNGESDVSDRGPEDAGTYEDDAPELDDYMSYVYGELGQKEEEGQED